MKKKWFIVFVLVFGFAFLFSSCDDKNTHPSVRTTVQFGNSSYGRSIARSLSSEDRLEIFIDQLFVNDPENRGLFIMGESGGEIVKGWYDVLNSPPLTTPSDYNVTTYYEAHITIIGIRGSIGGNEFNVESTNPHQGGGIVLVVFNSEENYEIQNKPYQGPKYHDVSYYSLRPFTPFNVYSNTTDVIITVSMDTDNIYDNVIKDLPANILNPGPVDPNEPTVDPIENFEKWKLLGDRINLNVEVR